MGSAGKHRAVASSEIDAEPARLATNGRTPTSGRARGCLTVVVFIVAITALAVVTPAGAAGGGLLDQEVPF